MNAVAKCDLRLAVDPKWIGSINGLATQSTMILQKLMG
jgi:hypothetical protein